MKTKRFTIFANDENQRFIIRGLRSRKIFEPCVPVLINGSLFNTTLHGFEIYQANAARTHFPQTVSDLCANFYLRLTPQNTATTSATFGTSIVGSPSFRLANGKLHFAPRAQRAELCMTSDFSVKIAVTGIFDDLARVCSTRSYTFDGLGKVTAAEVDVMFLALRDIHLHEDEGVGPGDKFRVVTVSSMYTNKNCYDANVITFNREGGILVGESPRPGYLLERPEPCTGFSVLKLAGSKSRRGTAGASDSPSLSVEYLGGTCEKGDLALQGYITDSLERDDDSLTVWMEWLNCPSMLKAGREIRAKVRFEAFSASNNRKSTL